MNKHYHIIHNYWFRHFGYGIILACLLILGACSSPEQANQAVPTAPTAPTAPSVVNTPVQQTSALSSTAQTTDTTLTTPSTVNTPIQQTPIPSPPSSLPHPPIVAQPSATPEPNDQQPSYATRDLSLVWSFETGSSVKDSPIVQGDMVYIASEEALFALEQDTGNELWAYRPQERIWSRSMVLHDDTLLVGLQGQYLVSLDAQNGQERWRTTLSGDVQRSAIVSDTIAYVGTTFVGPGLESDPEQHAWIYALNISDGSEVWSFETDNYLIVTPTLSNATLYAGGSYYDPSKDVLEGGLMRMYALDTTNGSVVWSFETEFGLIKEMIASDTRLHYLAYQDKLLTIDTTTGEELWFYHTENWTPSFLVADDIIYFGVGNGFAHAVDARTGEQIWKTRLDIFRRPLEAPHLVDDTLYLAVAQKQIFALDATSGDVLWVAEHDIESREGIVIADGLVYLVDIEGGVHAFVIE